MYTRPETNTTLAAACALPRALCHCCVVTISRGGWYAKPRKSAHRNKAGSDQVLLLTFNTAFVSQYVVVPRKACSNAIALLLEF